MPVPRPDGSDPNCYKNIHKWSDKKRAWELLRRYDSFIQACEKAIATDSPKIKRQVARQFHLKEFKYYKEPYRGDSGIPKFTDAALPSWSNLSAERQAISLQKKSLAHGRSLIEFNIKNIAEDPNGLKRQLSLTEQKLRKRAQTYRTHMEPESVAQKSASRRNDKNFLLHLRLLDARHAGKTYAECARMLFPEKTKDMANSEAAELVNKMIKAAQKNAAEGYQALASSSRKLRKKS